LSYRVPTRDESLCPSEMSTASPQFKIQGQFSPYLLLNSAVLH
jgi:hypothetical protein